MTAGRVRWRKIGKEFNVTRERIRQIEAKATAQAEASDPLEAGRGISSIRTKLC